MAGFCLGTAAQAHHGQEFFLLYDAGVQPAGHGILQGNFSLIEEGGEGTASLSPSLTLGLLPRTAFNLRADFSDDAGKGWAYHSFEPGFQFDLTPSGMKLPVRFGLAVAYQFSSGSGHGGNGGAEDMHGGGMAHIHTEEPAPAAALSREEAVTEVSHDHGSHPHPASVAPPETDLGPDALTPEELASMNPPAPATPAPAPAPANSQPAPKPKPKPGPKAPASKKETSRRPFRQRSQPFPLRRDSQPRGQSLHRPAYLRGGSGTRHPPGRESHQRHSRGWTRRLGLCDRAAAAVAARPLHGSGSPRRF